MIFESNNLKNKRKHPRIQVKAYVDFTGSEVLLYNNIENISLGGLCISGAAPELVGSVVDLEITLPETEQSIEMKGEVMWSKDGPPPEMGIKFVNLSDSCRKILEAYLAQVEKGEAE